LSRENVQAVVSGLEAAVQGGASTRALPLDTDIEWDISAHPLPDFPPTGHGRDALLEHMDSYFSGWNNYEASVSQVLDGGDDVVVILHERARMRESATILERDLVQVWTVGAGTWRRFRVFKTAAEALEAVGLEG
jgi:ketosteroid isomerase-like protein